VRHQEGEKNKGAREKQTEKTSQAIECYGADSRGRAGERPGRVPEILVVGEVSAPFYDAIVDRAESPNFSTFFCCSLYFLFIAL
jgi:hypothetical protein